MNKISRLFILSLFISTCIFSQNNSEVKSRTSSDEVQKKLNEQAYSTEKHDCDKKLQTGAFNNQYPPIFFPYSCHSLSALSALGDSIILEDGSIWSLNARDSDEVLSWKESDPLLIYPNTAWFSSYKYKIINQVLNTSVEVTLTYGPIIGGDFSLQIIAIDYMKGELFLSDNSRWMICSSDKYLLSEWLVGDYIIVGSNNSPWVNFPWVCSLKNILINSNMYNHIRAQQF